MGLASLREITVLRHPTTGKSRYEHLLIWSQMDPKNIPNVPPEPWCSSRTRRFPPRTAFRPSFERASHRVKIGRQIVNTSGVFVTHQTLGDSAGSLPAGFSPMIWRHWPGTMAKTGAQSRVLNYQQNMPTWTLLNLLPTTRLSRRNPSLAMESAASGEVEAGENTMFRPPHEKSSTAALQGVGNVADTD